MADRPRLLPLFEGSNACDCQAGWLHVWSVIRASEFQRVLLATFSINARIKDRDGVSPLEDRLRHFDPFGTEFCEAGAGQPFAIKAIGSL
jgi:hypothetical protein